MNIAIFSDTHSNTGRMVAELRRCQPDIILHTPDSERCSTNYELRTIH